MIRLIFGFALVAFVLMIGVLWANPHRWVSRALAAMHAPVGAWAVCVGMSLTVEDEDSPPQLPWVRLDTILAGWLPIALRT